ncbi:lmo0937 family membrane protein [Mucilaginibacter galii]|uniref:lmo0937 family membrane protein n=1 Tax=Mucilaginibacter galii TaxID=2005073 RepID=UPI001664C492|nr:lmo0937 family membrane protein [Mucilaginibacter galii]
MRSLLYIIAVILVIGWAISVFAYSIGGLIHILIVIAIISLVLGLFRGPSSTAV